MADNELGHEEWLADLERRNEASLRKLAAYHGWPLNWDVWPASRETEELQPYRLVVLTPGDFA